MSEMNTGGVVPPTVSKPGEKFNLFLDLGVIEVPAGYKHPTWLKTFFDNNKRKFRECHPHLRDSNFSNPSRIFLSGEKFGVHIFNWVGVGKIGSKDWLEFLGKQGVLLAGPQGLALVFDQKCDQLPKGQKYVSLDQSDRLYVNAGNKHQVPVLNYRGDGAFFFELSNFTCDWYGQHVFVAFYQV